MFGLAEILVFVAFAFQIVWTGIVFYGLYRLARWSPPQKDYSYTPRTSIIVAAWNEGSRIEALIKSLLAQDYPKNKTEIIIVGGGDEKTFEICGRFQKKGKIKFFGEKSRGGKWRALNRGLDAAHGEVIAFTDADCVPSENWLREIVASLGRKGVSGVVGNVVSTDKGYINKAMGVLFPFVTLFSIFVRAPLFCGQASAFRAEVFKKIKFRESIVEDLALTSDMRSAGMKIIFDKYAKVVHRYPLTTGGLINAQMRLYLGTYQKLKHNPIILLNLVTVTAWPLLTIASLYGLFYGSYTSFSLPLSLVQMLVIPTTLFFTVRYFLKKHSDVPEFKRSITRYHAIGMAKVTALSMLSNMASVAYYLTGRRVVWQIYKK